jgi:hypothetical protein
MRKLEDIPKKTPFKVPDGYFDRLPTVIQARMAKGTSGGFPLRVVSFSLKFVLPVVALVTAGIFWFRPVPTLDSQLDEIDTGQIALYLTNVERLDLEEANDANGWTTQELDQLEDTIYSNMDSNEEILDNIDLDNL